MWHLDVLSHQYVFVKPTMINAHSLVQLYYNHAGKNNKDSKVLNNKNYTELI